MLEYKVVEQKQKSFLRGRMTAQDLENSINQYAAEGWTLDRIVAGETAEFMGLGDKDVFLLVFKRERP
jgi:hypothetical protein